MFNHYVRIQESNNTIYVSRKSNPHQIVDERFAVQTAFRIEFALAVSEIIYSRNDYRTWTTFEVKDPLDVESIDKIVSGAKEPNIEPYPVESIIYDQDSNTITFIYPKKRLNL